MVNGEQCSLRELLARVGQPSRDSDCMQQQLDLQKPYKFFLQLMKCLAVWLNHR